MIMSFKALFYLYIFIFACSFFCALDALDSAPSPVTFNCDRERKILTNSYGVISSGNKEYPMDSHCEWLIRAADKNSFITITFTRMDTECSYDHVFLYDGDSYSSPLLGSFSGNTTPPSITSTRNSLLILLYSDTNYVRSGFEAVYSVTPCPANCSDRGTCQNHHCICDSLWSGESCSVALCPHDCGHSENRGKCDWSGDVAPHCRCEPGYSGWDCSLPDSNKYGGNSWHLVSPTGISARASHTGTYVQSTDSLYVFGGFTFKQVLGDTLMFSFRDSRWTRINTDVSPSPRHGHSAVCYHDNVIVFGGELEDENLSNELWFFNTTSLRWSLITPQNGITPPPIARHSVTLVDFYWLYVIGGTLSDGTFSSEIYRINVRDTSGWEAVETFGGQESSRRLVGHSTVYHQPAKTIFVFGGITAEYSHVSKLTNLLYAFHVEKKYWIRILYERNSVQPLERAFHSAAIVGDYMIVYGGYTHKHVEEEVCYDNETHLYHLRCHKWIDVSHLRKDFVGPENPMRQGVFSHTMGVRRGHTLLIFGGYSGWMRSHLLAYVLPSAVFSDQLLLDTCSRHKSLESCTSNLACGWCSDSESCIERKSNKGCNKFAVDTCPGLCNALSDCFSCLIWGQPYIENVINDRLDPFPSFSCMWCIHDAKCHTVDDYTSNCSASTNSSARGQAGSGTWWGSTGMDALTLEDCYLKDSPPGLISVKYRHPVNMSQPDAVSYLRLASEGVLFRSELQRFDSNGEDHIVKFLGFLHPLDAKPLSKRMSQLRLSICSAGSSAVFKLSNDSSPRHLEIVASHSPRPSYYCSEVVRGRGVPLFPDPSEGHKYAFDFTVKVPAYLNETSVVQLKWTAFSVDFEVIDDKHLELFKNGSCTRHRNCLACLTDSLCGWCEILRKCHPRSSQSANCQKSGKGSFLVTQPDNCSLCSDYIYCQECTQSTTCEWLVETAVCVRRGRFRLSVEDSRRCPRACSRRTSCVSCLGDPGMCAWCEESQTCFLFSTYTSTYAFGKCRDWVDENRSAVGTDLCRNCSRHTQCSSCIRNLACGWCSSLDHPMNGFCTDGDFSGPVSGSCSGRWNETGSNGTQWSYGSCPDLEECLWGLHDCHENATCTNTPDAYTCECEVGFEGDGKTCERACTMKCVQGYCSNAPDYRCVCNLGWTGDDCSVDCGCNNHSTCLVSVGVCDECQDWSEGTFCEICKAGSYGNATGPDGCRQCDCNGHGDAEIGFCDTESGVCSCLNHTVGPNCERCQEGYYGDARDNGLCFEACHPRRVITSAVEGRFGSPARSAEYQDCLWLLTVHSVLDMQSLLGPMQSTGTYLQVTIHSDIDIPCPHNHVYVYDGLPNFVASGHPNVLLGAFCGTELRQPIVATASSGYLTVHFKRDAEPHGFNASYVRLVSAHHKNCTSCLPEEFCPENCSAAAGHGRCDPVYGVCLCAEDFGGEDCSVRLTPQQLSWSVLYSHQGVPSSSPHQPLPVGRIGHSLTTFPDPGGAGEHVLLFGGYSSSSGPLNDLFIYNTTTNYWNKIVFWDNPPPRHFHAATALNSSVYIFGGVGEGALLGDFWEFTSDLGWVQLPEITTPSGVLTLAGSNLIPVASNRILLFGGYSPSYGFFEKVMEFDTDNKLWSVVNCTGSQPLGLYGHTTVYHEGTDSVYVFGGVFYDMEHVGASNYLYSFHYPSGFWSRLPPDKKVNKMQTRPSPRYFHMSAVTEDYLVVMGGRGSGSSDSSIQPFVYVFACNLWIPLTDEAIEVVGEWPKTLVGGAAATANGDLYLFGHMEGNLMRLRMPADICLLFSANRVGCMQQIGCAFCSVSGVNETVCFSRDKRSQNQCYNPREHSKLLQGVHCNDEWLEKRDCHQYKSCTDCIASWPTFKLAKQACQWCSNCRNGRCVPAGSSCEDESDCNIPRKIVDDLNRCPLRYCAATDCEKCGALKTCIWTRQVLRSGGFGHTLNKMPIYNWACVMREIQSAPSFPIDASPPLECPTACPAHSNCSACLQSGGSDGGWKQCVWSETLQSCMSPTYELLACEDGRCGLAVRGNDTVCPVPCWQHAQAAHCLAQANCGWCAFSGPLVDGRGLCMDGGIMGPTGGICRENQVLLNGLPLPSQTLKWFQVSEGAPVWTYLVRPAENECENGHHSCDPENEQCVDTEDGFECRCKPGYKMKGKHCEPTCPRGCVNGTCVMPDVCRCHFGFVGHNCSTMCRCNGHSDCPGPEDLDSCLDCKNNTFGSQCQKCKPLFVGNPVNSGSCVSCSEYCHTHSGFCFSPDVLNATFTQATLNHTFLFEFLDRQVEGPLDDAVCVDCRNNTEGKRCDQCVGGFFKAGEKLEDGCRACECNGHGDSCNPLNGENCNCQNNTENDRQCAQKNMKNMLHMTPCWQLQCSKCTEYFLGSPSNGHQCYRHMYLDKEYCFDPNTQGECNRTPIPLRRGQTVFFAVQPRYMNVNIRIVVDITRGGADFFLSAREDAFIVDVDRGTGLHRVYVDEKYGIDLSRYEAEEEEATVFERRRRSSEEGNATEETTAAPGLRPKIGEAQGLTTYIDVKKYEDFLLVRGLKDRLVVTIPQEVHDLRTTRFYMILRGTEDETFGSLFFRQDQTRIDLFVFFSVFFSCFFLFLAVCVVAWKVKQAFDMRRARRLHAAEMKHMASRPFAKVVVVLTEHPDEETDDSFSSSSPCRSLPKKGKRLHAKAGRDSPRQIEELPSVRALAIEPLADGYGAIATILVQFPGGAQSLMRMALASALITSRTPPHHLSYGGLRAAMRRRTSHANV